MSESVVADFVGSFDASSLGTDDPIKGRVLLSERQLVLAVDDSEAVRIPVERIFDVAVGTVPPELSGFFDSTVTIAFERDGREVATVEATDQKIEKFSTVLFKTLLNETPVRVKHPAREGGRVTDAAFRPARLALETGRVLFRGPDREVELGLGAVVSFDRSVRSVGGTERPTIEVRHTTGRRPVVTMAATESARVLSILGRYLRLEYAELRETVEETELSPEETELLLGVYSGAGEQLAGVVGVEPATVRVLVDRLEEKGLIEDGPRGPALTSAGQVVITERLERVNG